MLLNIKKQMLDCDASAFVVTNLFKLDLKF